MRRLLQRRRTFSALTIGLWALDIAAEDVKARLNGSTFAYRPTICACVLELGAPYDLLTIPVLAQREDCLGRPPDHEPTDQRDRKVAEKTRRADGDGQRPV